MRSIDPRAPRLEHAESFATEEPDNSFYTGIIVGLGLALLLLALSIWCLYKIRGGMRDN